MAFGVTSFAMTPLELRLDKQMKTWQKRLGLEDWTLSVRVVRQSALEKHTWGNADWDPAIKSGTINVSRPPGL